MGELLDALRSSWAWEDELSFVAHRDDGELVGHVLYTRAILDTARRLVDVLVLGPVGVRPDLHRSGIGSRLITRSLEVVSERSEPLVFLEGHPTYYPRFGFKQGAKLGFVAPSLRIPPAAFQVYRLPRYEPWMTGTLVYPDAVWRADAVGPPRTAIERRLDAATLRSKNIRGRHGFDVVGSPVELQAEDSGRPPKKSRNQQ